MRIISRSTIKKYYEQHPSSKTALEDWAEKVCKAEWKSFADIRKTFNSVDSVGNQHYVFNIKGNDFRLVAIRFIGTHSEYDRIKDIHNI